MLALVLTIWAACGVGIGVCAWRAPFRPDLDPDLTDREIAAQLYPPTGEVFASTRLPSEDWS
jgi:hypothetical protein